MSPPAARLAPLIATAAALALGLPAAAHAAVAAPRVDTAPGRIVLGVDDGSVQNNVEPGGVQRAVALPDGSALLFGAGADPSVLYAAKIGPAGALDRSFGNGGIASLPAPGGALYALVDVLRQADGRLLLVSTRQTAAPPFSFGAMQVTRMNADLSLDRSYGSDGTATSGIGPGTAALAPDGSLVLSGSTGELTLPTAPSTLRWALTRLTPGGVVDTSFGSGGIVTIAPEVPASGADVGFGPGGTIVAEGQSAGPNLRLMLTRLTSAGAPDSSFGGGVPVVLPLAWGRGVIVQDDGAIVLDGALPTPQQPAADTSLQRLVRYTASGAPDPGFGAGGLLDLGSDAAPSQILPAAGHGVIVVDASSLVRRVSLVTAGGTIAGTRDITPRFGGGTSGYIPNSRPTPLSPFVQNSFFGRGLLPRPDGSYLVPGSASVSQPSGEGAGFSVGRFAVAALTDEFAPDTSFGGPATPPVLSVRLRPQRAATARTRHGIRLQVDASRVGLARVKVARAGRALAYSVLPVFQTGRHTIVIELTRYGITYLRRHHDVRVTITATGRDLLTNTVRTTARGRLR